MNGKIARLPRPIREQLNQRLDNSESQEPLLDWLNSLPEVQAILAAHFEGQPITKQNLYSWSQFGFRNWKLRQQALEFAALDESDDPALQSGPQPGLTDKLVHWLALRYAAAAHTLAPLGDDPDAELRRLRSFAADIVALRRGDLYSSRILLEQQRLALLAADSEQQREKDFWQWTKRPDIRAKLRGDRQKEQAWHNALRKLMPEAAPFLPPLPEEGHPDETAETADPALLI